MRSNRFLRCAVSLFFLLCATPAFAQIKLSQLPAASTQAGTEILPEYQAGSCSSTGGTCGVTSAQLAAYALALLPTSNQTISGSWNFTGTLDYNGVAVLEASSTAVIGLWTGTCNVDTVLLGSGACSSVNLSTSIVTGLLPAANFQTSSSFTATVSGPYASPITGTLNYTISGNIATIYANAAITGTATTAAELTVSGLPASLTPSVTRQVLSGPSIESNTTVYEGGVTVASSTLTIGLMYVSGTNITGVAQLSATGTDGIASGFTISYPLN